jgi:hypothetical protein
VAAHEMQAGSRVWASPLAAPGSKPARVPSSASGISVEAALVEPSRVTCY